MKEIKQRIIKMYQRDNGESPVISWMESLDSTIRYRIKSRLTRVTQGNFGDHESLGDGLYELKFKFGSGYRIYYSEANDEIILLLCSGDKKTQGKDIKLARTYLNDYLQEEDHG